MSTITRSSWNKYRLMRLAVAGVLCGNTGSGEVPYGYEIVEVVSSDDWHHLPRINDCGEFVYYRGFPADSDSEIIHYDNGRISRLTDNNVPDSLPDINNSGVVVWTRGYDGVFGGEVLRLASGTLAQLGMGWSPIINIRGDVAWSRKISTECPYEGHIYLHTGGGVQQISDGMLSNQTPKLNDNGQIAWTRYDFTSCAIFDWTSTIMLYTLGTIVGLPTSLENPQSPDINNDGTVVWGDFDHVELYSGGETTVFSDGSIPSINDNGDVAFQRWHPYWVAWVYLNGAFYQISNDPPGIDNGRLDINNDGEVVWKWQVNADLTPSGIRLMRRIRKGDFNFDGATNMADYANLHACLTGPGDFARLCHCQFYDLQRDRDVDLHDVACLHGGCPIAALSHNCCDIHHGQGCDNSHLESCVCAAHSPCCTEDWTEHCVTLVQGLGCGTCP